ncbi:Acyl dehydratase [Rhodococcus rhodochrous J3]|jgi:acyl dehydratase|uniref:Acyl dehydratase n=3 Tax=Rhodococcus rhodochrous TaxID=1829 RepID=A0A562EQ41_RHORH|nr:MULTISPECIES: MaoC family dehydratase [Rhodococcus]MCR8693602.1 MaoC family dehydratase [Rhodococcus pyridinivorans]AYA24059.1 MaoC family dehydratase [Rhodococcus rhodochrous]MBF4479981.1 MaoC family dehydratase [Rhodococcus rhodochrous]MCB8910311.1 MaoC family dehydratase [Rhodococcus rhodochrous]MCD2098880.1 MaoC family dehydratase [Rhodococcus rhodochrous]
MRVFNGIDEVEKAVGEHLGHSDWLEIDQKRIDLFAEATGDHQWIHVDPERAKDGPYGKTIAHGYLTLSLLPVLGTQIFSLEGLKMKVNYGSNKVRYPAPVPVGSRIRAGAEFKSLERTAKGANLVVGYTIEIEGGERPALVAETVVVLVP